MKKIFNEAVSSIDQEKDRLQLKLNEYNILAKAMKDNKSVPFKSMTEKERQVISRLRTNREKNAYKIGCTVNVVDDLPLDQEFLFCRTCKDILKKDVVICVPCGIFCHAGHDLNFTTAYNNRISCGCGGGRHSQLPINDDKNPLVGILGRDRINKQGCSIIKPFNVKANPDEGESDEEQKEGGEEDGAGSEDEESEEEVSNRPDEDEDYTPQEASGFDDQTQSFDQIPYGELTLFLNFYRPRYW